MRILWRMGPRRTPRTDDRQDRADGCQRHLRLLQKKRQQCYQRQPRDRLDSCASLSGHGETGPAPRIKGNYKQYEVFSYDKNLLVEDNQHTGALISLPIATDRRSSK